MKTIDPSIYNDFYFREIEGHEDYYVFTKVKKIVETDFSEKVGRVLDVGCGRGETLKILTEKGWKCSGVDYSPSAIAKAQKNLTGLEVNLEVAGVPQVIYPDRTFDLVLFLNVWEHLNDSEIDQFFTHLVKFIKKDGVFIIQTSPTRYQVRFGHFFLKIFMIRPASLDWHVNEQSFFSFSDKLRKFGFSGRVWMERMPNFWASQVEGKYAILKNMARWLDFIIDSRVGRLIVDRFPLNLFFATDLWAVVSLKEVGN